MVSLVDVGAFEGDTILDICRRVEEEGIKVDGVYLGFSSEIANGKIGNRYRYRVLNSFNLYEWIELRDFFGIDGRNIENNDGQKMFIPYWENLIKWASVPEENEKEVRELCISYNQKLMYLLKEDGQDTAKIGKAVMYEGKR